MRFREYDQDAVVEAILSGKVASLLTLTHVDSDELYAIASELNKRWCQEPRECYYLAMAASLATGNFEVYPDCIKWCSQDGTARHTVLYLVAPLQFRFVPNRDFKHKSACFCMPNLTQFIEFIAIDSTPIITTATPVRRML